MTKIKGIYIQPSYLEASYASLEEIRNALLDFKESGKFIVAYADQYAQGMYYLSSVADKIIINPQGSMDGTEQACNLFSSKIWFPN